MNTKKEPAFISINYLKEHNAILASSSGQIKFFNLEDLELPVVIQNTEIHLNTSLPGKYLCDIVVSDDDLDSHMRVIALGDR